LTGGSLTGPDAPVPLLPVDGPPPFPVVGLPLLPVAGRPVLLFAGPFFRTGG
jgi:hypothetical protein